MASGYDEAVTAIPRPGAATDRHRCDTSVVVFDQYGVALLVAILSGGLAFVINATWPVHNCGNRYCRHVSRDEDFDEQDLG